MYTISTILTAEQSSLAEDVTITSTGGIKFGSYASPSSAASATMQFEGAYSLVCNGVLETYTTYVNLGVTFGKISGAYTYYDGSIDLAGATVTIVAKNSGSYTSASGFWGGNLTFNAFDDASGITVSSLSQNTSTSVARAYANATGIYASGTVGFSNGFAGSMRVTAKGGSGAWGDAQSDGVYALNGVYISGGLSGSIEVTADGQSGGTAGETFASAITAGSKDSHATLNIDSFTGSLSVRSSGGTLSGALTGSANGTAYGLYGSDGVNIDVYDGSVTVNGNGGSISAATKTAYSQGRAFGVYSRTGDVVIGSMRGGDLYVSAKGGTAALYSSDYATTPADVSAYAYGINTHGNLQIDNLNSYISVYAESGGSNSTLYSNYGRGFTEAHGVFAEGDITITSSDEEYSWGTIDVTATAGNVGGWSYSAATAYGIEAGNTISDSVLYSYINVNANGVQGRTDSIADGFGIAAHEGIYNSKFYGDITVSVSASTTGGSEGQAHGYGIYCANRTFGTGAQSSVVGNVSVNVTGSQLGNGQNLPSTAFGIYAGWINLEVTGTISATVNGNEGYAIYIDHTAGYADMLHLRRNANFEGVVELAGGANRVYLYQGASGLNKIQATGGTLNLVFSFDGDIDGDAMVAGGDISNFNSIGFYVSDNAASTTYCMMESGYSNYLAATYSVSCGNSTYSVAADTWTQLGDSGKWIQIGVVNGKFQAAIRDGGYFLGAGLNASGQAYWTDVRQNMSGQTIATVAGGGRVTSGSAIMLGDVIFDISDSTINAVYGGNSHAGGGLNMCGIDFTITNSTVGSFFGGGIGTNQQIDGNVTVTLNHTSVTGGFYGVGAASCGNSSWSHDVNLTVEAGELSGYFYGGSASISTTAAANNVYGNISIAFDGDVDAGAQIYGGNRYVSSVSGSNLVSGAVTISIGGGSYRNYLFAGSMAWANGITGNAEVVATVAGGTSIAITGGDFSHEVYGGGYAAANSNTSVTAQAAKSVVENGSRITVTDATLTNLYGGGYNAGAGSIVYGGSSISLTGAVTVGAVYGGGNGTGSAAIRGASVVYGGTAITIAAGGGAISVANIYGGGNSYTTVEGGSVITFSGDFLNGASSLSFTGVLSGGGRNRATVSGERRLVFDGFTGNVDARVMEFDTITVSGASDAAFTRGYSATELKELVFNCASGYGELIFANEVTDLSADLKVSVHLASGSFVYGSRALLESLATSLEGLAGHTYELYVDDDDTASYSGVIGDGGFNCGDFNLALNVAGNGSSLELAISAAATGGLGLENDPLKIQSLLA